MIDADIEFRRAFRRKLTLSALAPDHPLYVPLREHDDRDPIRRMRARIDGPGGESVQLFSGFPGSGKSTELRRLKRDLESDGLVVVLADIGDYLNLSGPIEITDFLVAVGGALGEGLAEGGHVTAGPNRGAGACFARLA